MENKMSNGKKILVADDDRFIRELLRTALSKAGFELIFAEDGQTAVEMSAAEKPDLVLSDGLLPRLHGFEVCKAIKQTQDPPKVVLLTGIYTKPTYKWQVIQDYGADAVLTKPFDVAQLLACIDQQLSPVESAPVDRSQPAAARV
jgi:two-component system, OmpR family, response regulator VicR